MRKISPPTGIRSQDRPALSELRLVQLGQLNDNVVGTVGFYIYLFMHGRTPIIWINWGDEASGYAENPDNWIFL
jgi:hypothetical protein